MALHVCILAYLKSVPLFLDHPVLKVVHVATRVARDDAASVRFVPSVCFDSVPVGHFAMSRVWSSRVNL